jgi:hypothetical protein
MKFLKVKPIAVIIAILFIILIVLIYFFFPRFGKTTLNLSANIEDVEVVINNQIYYTPTTVEIDPGKYTVWAFKEGYEEYKKVYNIKKGWKNKLYIELNKSYEAQPPEGAPMD